MHTDPSTSGRKYHTCKSVCNAVFIHNKSLNVVSAAATSAFQLKHMPRLLGSICPVGYQIRTIEYGKILVMLLYGKYYWRVYEVYNNFRYLKLLRGDRPASTTRVQRFLSVRVSVGASTLCFLTPNSTSSFLNSSTCTPQTGNNPITKAFSGFSAGSCINKKKVIYRPLSVHLVPMVIQRSNTTM